METLITFACKVRDLPGWRNVTGAVPVWGTLLHHEDVQNFCQGVARALEHELAYGMNVEISPADKAGKAAMTVTGWWTESDAHLGISSIETVKLGFVPAPEAERLRASGETQLKAQLLSVCCPFGEDEVDIVFQIFVPI
ncbi:MAG: hypothetical protein GY948_22580 [Alphaproteobacteria bacterium]|nr:hypothetical protein [Alphaproteobacteria bacterium]